MSERHFTGQRWDSALSLYDYRARFYDPALGRFLQPDPLVPEPGNPQALNRYAYVYNNPLRYTDPSGHCPWCVVIGKAILQTAVDVGIDYLIARATGGEFHLARSLAVNAALNVTTLGIGSTVAKLRHLGKLATLASHADEVADAARVVARVAQEGIEQAGKALTREQVIQALGEAIQPYLKSIREIAGEEAQIGFRGSLARGTVGNPRKATFGQPINLNDFDVDAFIVSDKLARHGRWGRNIEGLDKLEEEIYNALKARPEFRGLRDRGFSFKIFTWEEAKRLFSGEEIYFVGGGP